jgi:hypothetical protein
MRFATVGLFALLIAGATAAHAGSANESPWRVAQNANACLINCASQNDSCKRMCPSSYSGPCLSACDNQAQFCQQNCQRR